MAEAIRGTHKAEDPKYTVVVQLAEGSAYHGVGLLNGTRKGGMAEVARLRCSAEYLVPRACGAGRPSYQKRLRWELREARGIPTRLCQDGPPN
jgi:hypothetical protein